MSIAQWRERPSGDDLDRAAKPTRHAADKLGAPPFGSLAHDRPAQPDGAQTEIDLSRLLSVLRRRYRLLLGAMFLSLLAALVYLMWAPPMYRAAVKLFIDPREQIVLGPDPTTKPDLAEYAVESEVEVISSARIAEQVILQLGIAQPNKEQYAGQAGNGITQSKTIPSVKQSETAAVPEDVLRKFMSYLSIRRSGRTNIVEVSYSDLDPIRAAQIANSLATAYIDDQLAVRGSHTRRVVEGLRQQIAQRHNQLNDLDKLVQNYRAEHNLHDVGGTSLLDRQAAEYGAQLSLARGQLIQLEARYRRLERDIGESTGGASQTTTLMSELHRMAVELKRKQAQLIGNFGPKHPEVESTASDLANVTREIENEQARIRRTLKFDYDTARDQVGLLENAISEVHSKIAERNQLAIQLGELERQAKAMAQLYTTLLSRHAEMESLQTLLNSASRVIVWAQPPSSPSEPRRSVVLAVALASGLGLGFLLMAWREYSDRTFHSIDDVQRLIGQPVAALLPAVRPPRTASTSKSRSKRGFPVLFSEELKNVSSAYGQSLSTIRESADQHRGVDGSVIAVVSPSNGDGKSSLAVNLAASAAAAGTRTLLVDADLRSPQLTEMLSPGARHTLVDVLHMDEKLYELLGISTPGKFWFCPGPAASPTLGQRIELFTSPRFATFLDQSRRSYELVVVDTSPMLQSEEVKTLIPLVDHCLVLLRCSATTQADAQKTLAEIEDSGGRSVHVILNASTV